MRSFLCGRCHLEFDLEGEFEETENSVFCPRCKTVLAQILPETPDRLAARAVRLRRIRQKQVRSFALLVVFSLAGWGITLALLRRRPHVPLLITAALVTGGLTGIWVRRLTSGRSARAGIFAALLFLFATAACLGITAFGAGHSSAFLLSTFAVMTAGVLPAWAFAVFDRQTFPPWP